MARTKIFCVFVCIAFFWSSVLASGTPPAYENVHREEAKQEAPGILEDELDNQENILSQLLGDYDKVKAISEGSGCQCKCVVRPLSRNACQRIEEGTANIEDFYTVETLSSGPGCKCACVAPPSAVNPCEGDYRLRRLQESERNGIKLSTIMELLEGAFYGLDLLKMHSVTTKLLDRVEKLERVVSHNHKTASVKMNITTTHKPEKETTPSVEAEKQAVNFSAILQGDAAAAVYAQSEKYEEKFVGDLAFSEEPLSVSPETPTESVGNVESLQTNTRMKVVSRPTIIRGITYYKSNTIEEDNEIDEQQEEFSSGDAAVDLLIEDQLIKHKGWQQQTFRKPKPVVRPPIPKTEQVDMNGHLRVVHNLATAATTEVSSKSPSNVPDLTSDYRTAAAPAVTDASNKSSTAASMAVTNTAATHNPSSTTMSSAILATFTTGKNITSSPSPASAPASTKETRETTAQATDEITNASSTTPSTTTTTTTTTTTATATATATATTSTTTTSTTMTTITASSTKLTTIRSPKTSWTTAITSTPSVPKTTRPSVHVKPRQRYKISWEEEIQDTMGDEAQKNLGVCKDTLSTISGPVTQNTYGRSEGAWMKDPMAKDDKIYVTNYYYGNTLIEFRNMENFKQGRWTNSYKLPYNWIGTGHVVYDGAFYYNRAFSRNIIKFDLKHRFVAAWAMLHDVVFEESTPWKWRGHSDIDFAVDENGLWVIYPAIDDEGIQQEVIVLSKLNPADLSIQKETTWRTGLRKNFYGNCFIVCGVLYAVDSYNQMNANISYAFDTHTNTQIIPRLPFTNNYSYTTQIDYNPKERVLYAWDNGHQVTYDVIFAY
ncbi:olfactomedin-like protein 2B [Erpetoichthys calabaricus]|uniref:Olfactomedin like 2B n=1 Tax=Erpetoichthys calabaricus TaxID=27687 RepID=A0A8C4X6Y8_ERPCA|nr:olfactomedin-like protein 2B [Erpetoichthys calabaricus]